ncbi:hypothetical protein CEXT_589621 [Caerostris extrusa]|uniref:EF-hand domain-containing protein n=1 Tax=Caerostris extrusa TaxID=172846 RepID=A0AAV4QQ96_CAEEX|nr:hypothetical protein CEXT_589621 [Caerostris extrusa]
MEMISRRKTFRPYNLSLLANGKVEDCPKGYLEEDTFRRILFRFYPCGNATLYARHVFRTFDRNKTGALTFK